MGLLGYGVFSYFSKPVTPTKELLQSNNYLEYSQDAFEQASTKRRVLFFFASWCPTCRVADPNFLQNASQIPADVVVFKTNYDSESTLKQKYAITYQHTFVQVDKDGNEITKWNGGQIEELLSHLK